MAFNYLSPSGIRLTNSEEQILDRVDKFSYSLNGYVNLADLHSRITVELSNKIKTRDYSYEITDYERVAEIDKLQERINKIDRLIDQKMQKFEEAQGPMRDALDRQLGELEVERALLRDIRGAYVDAEQGTNGNYIIRGYYTVLGEYFSSSKKVVLYIDSINSDFLLAIIYVHEMMHAYLDCGFVRDYFDKIEEPIVEYAMLNFFKAFDRQICAKAQIHVKEKQKELGTAHYGFGYCIFKNPNGTNWLEDYRNAKNSLAKTDPDVAAYLNYWKKGNYPEEEEKECLEYLYKALHLGNVKRMIIRSDQMHPKDFLNDLMQQQVAQATLLTTTNDFADYLSNCDAIDGGYNSYIRSLETNVFNDLLDQFGLPRNLYQCKAKDLVQVLNKLVDPTYKKDPYVCAALNYQKRSCKYALCYFLRHLLELNGIII